MSIQELNKSFFNYKIADVGSVFQQFLRRELNYTKPGVFFRYQTSLTHPSFERFSDSGPISWSNYHRAAMAHWINYPAIVTKLPFLLECNDHPLSALGFKVRGLHEPGEIVRRFEEVAGVYDLPQCKAIAIACDGYEGLFEYYFGKAFNDKFVELHCPGTIPKVVAIENGAPASFVCLASDYELKGVDLLIEAWLAIENRRGARLVIACPNVPLRVIERAKSDITFIQKAPLTNFEKQELLSGCNVSLGPMHVHGGANLFEGMEYGHAIIYFETHSTFFRTIGEAVSVPYYFYLPTHYGVEWKTFKEFRARLNDDKRRGLFQLTIDQLSLAIKRYIEHPELLYINRSKVLNAAYGSISLEARNTKLLQIYSQILGESY